MITQKDIIRKDRLEASGLMSAARFAKKLLKKDKAVSIDVVYELHSIIFKKSQPDIAGKLRRCEFKKLYHHIPPPASEIPRLIYQFSLELEKRAKKTKTDYVAGSKVNQIKKVVFFAAWASHKISYIHPFADGNGRTARLILNFILEKYGLPPIIITAKVRNRYLKALSQIDTDGDYEPSVKIILNGIKDHFDRLEKKKLIYAKTKHKK
jgi:Fic family protein